MDPFSFLQQEHDLIDDLIIGNFNFSPDLFGLTPAPPPPPELTRSSFIPYTTTCIDAQQNSQLGVNGNIHRRLIGLLRRIPVTKPEKREPEQSRRFRHMMNERQRRERLSQSYADLDSMIPFRAKLKSEKISIVQSAAAYVQQLKAAKERLEKRSGELETEITQRADMGEEGEVIRVCKADASSPVDSMIGALTCLKAMGIEARNVQSYFAGTELTAVFGVNAQVAKADVERALQSAFTEA